MPATISLASVLAELRVTIRKAKDTGRDNCGLLAQVVQLSGGVRELDVGLLDNIAKTLELEGYSELVPALLRTRNSLITVNRLAPELLSLIFEHAAIAMAQWEWFIGYPWKYVQAICSHWRQAALHTPFLWTRIQIPMAFSISDQSNAEYIEMCIRRAGALPLTVYLSTPVDGHGLAELVNTPHMRNLRVTSDFTDSLEHLLCTPKISQLGSLALYPFETPGVITETKYYDARETSYQLYFPTLETFVSEIPFRWFGSSFRMLRYLVLNNQRILEDVPRAGLLLRFLGSHPQLEDFVLQEDSGIDGQSWHADMDNLNPINMPCLKRLVVSSFKGTIVRFIEDKLILPVVQAVVYEFFWDKGDIVTPDFSQSLAQRFTSDRKLYLGQRDFLVVTDGQLSFCMALSPSDMYYLPTITALRYILQLYAFPLEAQQVKVRELWLGFRKPQEYYEFASYYEPGLQAVIDILEDIDGVEKLVLWGNIRFWLDIITENDLFPSLTELQIHDILDHHEPELFEFLEQRVEDGFPIETLRLVQEGARFKHSGKTGSAGVLERVARELPGSLVARVLLEDKLVRMELPEICTTPSTAHFHWKSWYDEYVDLWDYEC